MPAINFCARTFLLDPHCHLPSYIPFSFKASNSSCLHYFWLLLASRNPEIACHIQTRLLFKNASMQTYTVVRLLCLYIHIYMYLQHIHTLMYAPCSFPSHFALSVPSPPQLQCHSMGGRPLGQPGPWRVHNASHGSKEYHYVCHFCRMEPIKLLLVLLLLPWRGFAGLNLLGVGVGEGELPPNVFQLQFK